MSPRDGVPDHDHMDHRRNDQHDVDHKVDHHKPDHHDPERNDLEQAEELLSQLQGATSMEERRRLYAQIVPLTVHLADGAARAYAYRGIAAEDLTQVARLGLMKAIRGYRSERGHGFAAYAAPTISGELKRHFRDHGWLVRPPRRLQELRARMALEEELARRSLGRNPTERELADRLDVDVKTVAEVRLAASGYAAEPLVPAGDRSRPHEASVTKDPYQELADWDAIRQGLKTLTPRQLRVLRLRFVDDMTQAEIGHEIGLSQMQVSRILSQSLNQLRELANAA